MNQEMPPEIRAKSPDKVVCLDVRSALARGEEPFQAIMSAVSNLGEGQVLQLTAPFEPLPLYAVMQSRGFAHWTRQDETEDEPCFEAFFYRPGELSSEDLERELDDDDGLHRIDGRGLDLPGLLEHITAFLEELRYEDVLLLLHDCVPEGLRETLVAKGMTSRSHQVDEGCWESRIWRIQ